MDSKERLRIAIEKLKSGKNWTNTDIMNAIGYDSPNYLSNILAGKKSISSKFLRTLEEKLFIRQQWIETGEGEMLIDTGAILDRLIMDVFPDLPKKQQRAYRELLIIIAEINCAATGRPYLECLHSIFDRIDAAASRTNSDSIHS